ncbi:biotin/lipoyl-containing protein, partial [uncultured Parasutterella sp.]
MSIVEVKVPELSESVSEASLIEWKKKVGEPVKADEILIEIETDKIVLEIPSPADGVLSSIERPNGASVLSDQLIATVDTEAVASAPKEEAPKAEEAAPVRPAAQTAAAPKAPTVMPAAEKLMANSGIDAAAVAGTG